MVSKIRCYLTGLIRVHGFFAAKDILSLIFETDRHRVYREWLGQSGFGRNFCHVYSIYQHPPAVETDETVKNNAE